MKKVVSLIIVIIMSLSFVFANHNYFKDMDSNDYEITAEVYEGWNLLQGFHPSFLSSGSQIGESNIKAVFMYSPDKNEFIQLYPNNELPNVGLNSNDEYYDDDAGKYAVWVYIDDIQTCNDAACSSPGAKLNKVIYKTHILEMETINLKKGWNFVGINPEMYYGDYFLNEGNDGGYFSWDKISGSCSYNKIYAWNPEIQDWMKIESNLEIEDYDFDDFLGAGMLVKVADACSLKKEAKQIVPPSMPN